jgi:hypothetical protein
MAYRIILRRDGSSNWESQNPVLLLGEPGYETDSGKIKIGDGASIWSALDYYIGATGGTGSIGVTGPTGAGGTGANTFYGSQTIVGGTAGTLIIAGYSVLNFASDASAATGGVPLGGVYHNAGDLKIRIS